MIPEKAYKVIGKKAQLIDLHSLHKGDIILIKSGDWIPADGTLNEGATSVDETNITTHATVEKYVGSRLYAGSQNLGGQILMEVSRIGKETILAKKEQFLKTLEKKPQKTLKHLTNKIFKRKPIQDLQTILQANGIYVNEEILRKLKKTEAIVFDKTGIITTGARQIEHVVSYKPYTQQQVLNIAAALEAHSNHLAASVIVNFAKTHGAAALQRVENVTNEIGAGVGGILNAKKVLVGSAALFSRKKIKIPKETLKLKEEGLSVVYVSANKEVIGYIALSNPTKTNAREVISALKQNYRTVLFSGEHEDTAASIAKQSGMNETVAGVNEKNRNDKLKELKKITAYVTAKHIGSSSEITITMGTRLAFEADVTILHGNLSAIQTLFEIVKQNN